MGKLAKRVRTLAPAQSQQIEFEDDSGNSIVLSGMDVVQYLCPGATSKEVVFFMELCRAQRLNPFIREAFLVKYGSKDAQMITAEVVFERRANNHPAYLGMESGVVYIRDGQILRREGTATYKAAGEVLIGGWARVHRKDRTDYYSEVSLDEYDKKQSLWKTMPGVMINKCAKAVALRGAFPSDFQGMYVEEEIAQTPGVTEVAAEVLHDSSELEHVAKELADAKGQELEVVMDAIRTSKALASTGYAGGEMSDIQIQVAVGLAKRWLESVRESEDVGHDSVPTDKYFDADTYEADSYEYEDV